MLSNAALWVDLLKLWVKIDIHRHQCMCVHVYTVDCVCAMSDVISYAMLLRICVKQTTNAGCPTVAFAAHIPVHHPPPAPPPPRPLLLLLTADQSSLQLHVGAGQPFQTAMG